MHSVPSTLHSGIRGFLTKRNNKHCPNVKDESPNVAKYQIHATQIDFVNKILKRSLKH